MGYNAPAGSPSGKGDWQTPDPLFAHLDTLFGPFTLDAAASAENRKCPDYLGPGSPLGADALEADWLQRRVWLNPPYTRDLLGRFVAKAYNEAQRGALVVALLPADGSVAWWHDYVLLAETVLHVRGRVRFVDPATGKRGGSPTFSSAVVVWRAGRYRPHVGSLVVPRSQERKADRIRRYRQVADAAATPAGGRA